MCKHVTGQLVTREDDQQASVCATNVMACAKDVYGQLHAGGVHVASPFASPLGAAGSIALPKQPCCVGKTARYVLSLPFLPPACDVNGK